MTNKTGGPAAKEGGGREARRRPADEVRADVLRTVGDLLLAEAPATSRFERVAKAAASARPPRQVVASRARSPSTATSTPSRDAAFPDTGDVRADLLTQLRSFAHVADPDPGGAGAVPTDRRGADGQGPGRRVPKLYSSHRRRLAESVTQRAQEAGQIAPTSMMQVLVDQLWAPRTTGSSSDEPSPTPSWSRSSGNLLDGVGPSRREPAGRSRCAR
ncbi:TetR-like C-terminal domain-containing protein [Streptomyces sp. KL116D]|uniref:TetR-like C-terminal domain-containing protein n=1 Tax=Streptomyces sp. KL116D TaxID=3045152 RepID=UPI0035570336